VGKYCRVGQVADDNMIRRKKYWKYLLDS